jgi:hypothetical protein
MHYKFTIKLNSFQFYIAVIDSLTTIFLKYKMITTVRITNGAIITSATMKDLSSVS